MKHSIFLSLLAAAVLAGCGSGGEHKEGDGHDHAAETAAKAETAVKKDEHGHEGEAHTEGEAGHTEGEDEHSEESVKLNPAQTAIAQIETEAVAFRNLQPQLAVPGTISATTRGRAVVTPPVAGRVVSLAVSLGQSVQRGQVLAVIESTELADAYARITDAARSRDEAAARVSESATSVRLAEAKVAATRQTLARQKEFAAAGAFNQAPLQQAQSELNDAQSELLSAQKEQASHAEQLRRLENLFRDGLVSKSDLDAARLESQQDTIRVNRVTARVQTAKAAYDREKRIAERGLLNSREVQAAEADVKSAVIEVERARGTLRSSQALLGTANRAVGNAQATYRTFAGGAGASGGRVNLVAPLNGVISKFDVTRGQAVDRTQALFEVEDLRSLWATAQVPERDSAVVRVGTPVTITTAALPGQTFNGTVQIVATRVDPKTRSLAVQCSLFNDDLKLKPDMFVDVRIANGESRRALSVPTTAIVSDAGKNYVFVKDKEEFARHEVKLSSTGGKYVEILEGVEEGELVAVKGAFILKSQLKKDELKGHEH